MALTNTDVINNRLFIISQSNLFWMSKTLVVKNNWHLQGRIQFIVAIKNSNHVQCTETASHINVDGCIMNVHGVTELRLIAHEHIFKAPANRDGLMTCVGEGRERQRAYTATEVLTCWIKKHYFLHRRCETFGLKSKLLSRSADLRKSAGQR